MLLLFDIDGTLLLKAHGAHRESLHAALREIHGIADPAGAHIQAAGRTDGEIARAIALQVGISAERIDEQADAVREATCAEFARRCPPDLRDRVAPGMEDVLRALAGRAGTRLSLVTGNFEPVARLKLERAGLAELFPAGQGGFGSDDEDRAVTPWSSATPPTTSPAPGPTASASWGSPPARSPPATCARPAPKRWRRTPAAWAS